MRTRSMLIHPEHPLETQSLETPSDMEDEGEVMSG